jgi:myosin heavy subunit
MTTDASLAAEPMQAEVGDDIVDAAFASHENAKNTDTSPSDEETQKSDDMSTQDDKEEKPTSQESDDNSKELSEVEKVKASMQKRIDRLTARSSKAQELERELRELKSKQDMPKREPPKEESFETTEDYLKAVGKFEAETEFLSKQSEEKSKQLYEKQQEQLETLRKGFETKEAEFRKANADYDDVVENVNDIFQDVDPSNETVRTVAAAFMEADPALIYHLGNNPELLEQALEMPPLSAVRELTRIELSLEAPKPKPKSEPLPKPIEPISAGGSPKGKPQSVSDVMAWIDS